MKKLFLSVAFVVFTTCLFSQDTIKVMHYNLLNYGYYEFGCTTSNNDINDKNDYLRTIFGYILPDIFTVNEMYCNSNVANLLLDDALNENGINYFERAGTSCHSNYNATMNMLYYNTEKLGLADQYYVETDIRDITIYKLFSKTNLQYSTDSLFLYCIVAHLKAGSDYEDEVERNREVTLLMNYLNENFEPGNFMFMGDFNIYDAAEDAFKKMTNYSVTEYRFYDPINRVGDWHNNPSYTDIHTQSTHTAYNNCASTGGMDDRFDFIMVSKSILYGLQRVKVMPHTYKAVGQDGQHFNKALTDSPVNSTVPSDVVTALYNMSDHLPVYCELFVGEEAGIDDVNNFSSELILYTTLDNDQIFADVAAFTRDNTPVLKVYNIYGRRLHKVQLSKDQSEQILNVISWPKGMYIVTIEQDNRLMAKGRLIK